MTIKTIFLDRDGIVNKDIRYLYKIKDFEFVDGIFEACLCFHNLGYQIIIVTNQSGIFRGYYNESHYQELTQWMLSQFKTNNINIPSGNIFEFLLISLSKFFYQLDLDLQLLFLALD